MRFLPALAVVLLLAGCATLAGPGDNGVPLPDPHPAADRLVSGQGTVLQVGDAAPQLCFVVMESYPPQCSGPEVVGWDWDSIELKETASDVTWGSFALIGFWDGERFEVKEPPIPLALYDPMPLEPDPRRDPANRGQGTDAELDSIQRELPDAFDVVGSSPENGYLFVSVMYDDGSLQEYVDERYGNDRVVIESLLQRMDA